MSRFYNPYFFLPLLEGRDDDQCVAFDTIRSGAHDHIRHDLYHPDCNTGTITCTITTKTPTLVGNRHISGRKNESPGVVEPYEVAGKPAFPANSLNGMIGSVMEALSRSSLRVLEKRSLSRRKKPREALSAIGEIVQGPKNGLMLKPLTIPTAQCFLGKGRVKFRLKAKWAALFDGVPLKECLSIYIPKNSDVAKEYAKHRYARIPMDESQVVKKGWMTISSNSLKIKRARENLYFLLGWLFRKDEKNGPPTLDISEVSEAGYAEGRIKKLELEGLTDDQKKMHRYERFVPTGNGIDPIPIQEEAIERFTALAQEANQREPHFPLTQPEFEEHKVELKPGMLVFFDIEEKNGAIEVSEISHSSIWRRVFDIRDIHAAFGGIRKNLLPWKGERTHLTPAEQILGVVAEEDEGGSGQVNALAGRVRFSDALPETEEVTWLEEMQPFRILASPKPPCPRLYFHRVNGRQGLQPNGRKYYLHHRGEEMERRTGTEPDERRWWETKETEGTDEWEKTIHQKIKCRLIDEEQKFSFRIRFHNLTDAELGLLLASIEPLWAAAVVPGGKPQAEECSGGEFWHRLGLGKPLGLGSVKVELESLEIEEIEQGYTQWSAEPPVAKKNPEMDGYLRSAIDAGLIDEKVLEVLVALGDPEKVDAVVTYPVTQRQYEALQKGEAGGERELFKWFGSTAEQLVPDGFWQTPGGFHLSGRKLTAHANPGTNGGGGGRRGGGNRQAGRGSGRRPSGKKQR